MGGQELFYHQDQIDKVLGACAGQHTVGSPLVGIWAYI